MTLDEKVILVRLSNRLSWWFCCANDKERPDFKVRKDMTIEELDNELSEAYYNFTEKEKEKLSKQIKISKNTEDSTLTEEKPVEVKEEGLDSVFDFLKEK